MRNETFGSLKITLNLKYLPLPRRSELPKEAGIYFVVGEGDKVLYVGRTSNLYKRWQSHHRTADLGDTGKIKVAWINTLGLSVENVMAVEQMFIRFLKPELNIMSAGLVCVSRDEISVVNETCAFLSDLLPRKGHNAIKKQFEDYERKAIVEALEASNGSITTASRILGISHQLLDYKLRKTYPELSAYRKPIVPRRRSIIRSVKPREIKTEGERSVGRVVRPKTNPASRRSTPSLISRTSGEEAPCRPCVETETKQSAA
jgi:hypothetical protein